MGDLALCLEQLMRWRQLRVAELSFSSGVWEGLEGRQRVSESFVPLKIGLQCGLLDFPSLLLVFLPSFPLSSFFPLSLPPSLHPFTKLLFFARLSCGY